MIRKVYKTVFGTVLTSVAFLSPDNLTQGTSYLRPTTQAEAEAAPEQEEPCTIREETTSYPDGTQVVSVTWWGVCS